jgi:hypothetical protein
MRTDGKFPRVSLRTNQQLQETFRLSPSVQHFNFLFLLREPRNNRGQFIEYLHPALELPAIFRALHGFISNEGEFCLAVS